MISLDIQADRELTDSLKVDFQYVMAATTATAVLGEVKSGQQLEVLSCDEQGIDGAKKVEYNVNLLKIETTNNVLDGNAINLNISVTKDFKALYLLKPVESNTFLITGVITDPDTIKNYLADGAFFMGGFEIQITGGSS